MGANQRIRTAHATDEQHAVVGGWQTFHQLLGDLAGVQGSLERLLQSVVTLPGLQIDRLVQQVAALEHLQQQLEQVDEGNLEFWSALGNRLP
ncbi:hypothetical protein D9M68_892980 [compost metagenome]